MSQFHKPRETDYYLRVPTELVVFQELGFPWQDKNLFRKKKWQRKQGGRGGTLAKKENKALDGGVALPSQHWIRPQRNRQAGLWEVGCEWIRKWSPEDLPVLFLPGTPLHWTVLQWRKLMMCSHQPRKVEAQYHSSKQHLKSAKSFAFWETSPPSFFLKHTKFKHSLNLPNWRWNFDSTVVSCIDKTLLSPQIKILMWLHIECVYAPTCMCCFPIVMHEHITKILYRMWI